MSMRSKNRIGKSRNLCVDCSEYHDKLCALKWCYIISTWTKTNRPVCCMYFFLHCQWVQIISCLFHIDMRCEMHSCDQSNVHWKKGKTTNKPYWKKKKTKDERMTKRVDEILCMSNIWLLPLVSTVLVDVCETTLNISAKCTPAHTYPYILTELIHCARIPAEAKRKWVEWPMECTRWTGWQYWK